MLLVGLCGELKVMNIKNNYSGPPSACVCYADIWVKFDKFVTLFETENRGVKIVHFLVFPLPFKSWQMLFDTKKRRKVANTSGAKSSSGYSFLDAWIYYGMSFPEFWKINVCRQCCNLFTNA